MRNTPSLRPTRTLPLVALVALLVLGMMPGTVAAGLGSPAAPAGAAHATAPPASDIAAIPGVHVLPSSAAPAPMGHVGPAGTGPTIWTNLSTSTGPGDRYGAAMVYDAADGYSILFGGITGKGPYVNDTWAWKSGAWVNISGSTSGGVIQGAPSGRAFPAMTYDSKTGDVVLFGGYFKGVSSTNAFYLTDTWTFSKGVWTNVTTSVGTPPEGRWAATMAYDPSLSEIVLFGGGIGGLPSGTASKEVQETWVLPNSGSWTNETTTLGASGQPPARDEAAMAWDPQVNAVVLYGGQGAKGKMLNDTWWFTSSGKWTNVTSMSSVVPDGTPYGNEMGLRSPVLAYDSVDDVLVMFGGEDTSGATFVDASNMTYLYRSGNWTNITTWVSTPPATNPPNGTFAGAGDWDNASKELIIDTGQMVYSIFAQGSSDFTWGYQWHNVSSVLTVNRTQVPLSQSFILNTTTHGGTWNYTWKYVGLPPGCTSVDAATWTCTPTAIGTYNITVYGNDSSGTSSTSMVTVLVFEALTPSLTVEPTAIDIGRLLYLNTSIVGGSSGSHSLSFTGLPSGCSNTNSVAWTCMPRVNGTFYVNVTVTDSVGDSARSGPAKVIIYPRLGLTLAKSRSVLDAGSVVWFNGTPSGGDALYTYTWSNLPTGCSTLDVANLSCTPSASAQGTFDVLLNLTDTTGTLKNASVSVVVWPELTATIGETPVSGHAPLKVQFHSDVNGGDPPTLLTWEINTQVYTQPSFPVTFSTPGNYSVEFWANDSLGVSIYLTGSVEVLAQIPPLVVAVSVSPASGTADVGQTVTFSAVVSGGLPAASGYTYFWTSSVPAGCTANGASFACVPTRAEQLFATVLVNDSVNNSKSATGEVAVNPALGLQLSSAPAASCGATTVNFTAQISGGLHPYVINWTFPGGTTASGPVASHYFAATGNFSVSATVTDSSGSSNTSTTYVDLTTCSSSSSSNSGNTDLYLGVGAVIALLVVIALVALVMRSRRGGGGDEDAAAAEEPVDDTPVVPPQEGDELIYGLDRPLSRDSFSVGPTDQTPADDGGGSEESG